MYARVEIEDLEDLADADLVRRFKLGNDEAFAVLLGRHSEALYRFCCHLVPGREDAEDICQETLTRAMTRVDSLQTGGAFRSWLFSIARNLSIDSFRSKKRICPLPDEDVTPLPQHESSPHERIEAGEERETVAVALSKLRTSHQRVLMLREVEGLSYADIARELDVSQSAVETLLFRARRRLREEYRKRQMPTGGVALAGGLRALIARVAAPLAGGSPFAAKVTMTTALLAGTAAAVPVAVPHHSGLLVNRRVSANHAAAKTISAMQGPAIRQNSLAAFHHSAASLQAFPRFGGVAPRSQNRSISHGRAAVPSSRAHPLRRVSVHLVRAVRLTNQTVRRPTVHPTAATGAHAMPVVAGSAHQLSARPQPAVAQIPAAVSAALPTSRPATSIASVQAPSSVQTPALGFQQPVGRHVARGQRGVAASPNGVGKVADTHGPGAQAQHGKKSVPTKISAPVQSSQPLTQVAPAHLHGAGQGARASRSIRPDTVTASQSTHGRESRGSMAGGAGASSTPNVPEARGHSSANHAGSHGKTSAHTGVPAGTVPSGQPALAPAAPVTPASAPAVAPPTSIPPQSQIPPGQAKKNAVSAAPVPIQSNASPQTGAVSAVAQTQSQPASVPTSPATSAHTPPGQEKKQGKSHP